jgi:hypothetical protein
MVFNIFIKLRQTVLLNVDERMLRCKCGIFVGNPVGQFSATRGSRVQIVVMTQRTSLEQNTPRKQWRHISPAKYFTEVFEQCAYHPIARIPFSMEKTFKKSFTQQT